MTEIKCLLEECIHSDEWMLCTMGEITLIPPKDDEALLYCEQWESAEEAEEEG